MLEVKLVLKKEVKDKRELEIYIKENRLDLPEYSLAVIAQIMDKDGNILLQRRGLKARDDSNKLADIGGAVEESDINFIEALNRELKEEVGNKANITVNDFVGGFLERKYNPEVGKDVNWLFLVYKCTYIDGDLLCNEFEKSIAYEFYKYDELPRNEMLETTKYFWDYYNESYNKCYSYAMGIGNKINLLDKDKFMITEDDGDYEVIFNKFDISIWEKFIIDNMECGFWNDYIVDDKIVIIFKENNGEIKKYILSKDNNQEILNKFCLFAETKFESIRKVYLDTPFYSNHINGVIFFD